MCCLTELISLLITMQMTDDTLHLPFCRWPSRARAHVKRTQQRTAISHEWLQNLHVQTFFCFQFLQSYTVLEPDIINVRVHTDACRTTGLAVGDNAKRAAAVGQICCECECPAERKHSGSWVKKHQSAKH